MRGKTIVITGAFGVLGRAAAELAKAQGADVAMLGRHVGEQNITPPELGVAVDVADRRRGEQPVARVPERLFRELVVELPRRTTRERVGGDTAGEPPPSPSPSP